MPSPDRLWQAEIGELVNDGYPDVALGNLPVKRTGEESIPQLLEPIHHVFGNAASVVAGGFLPSRSPLGFRSPEFRSYPSKAASFDPVRLMESMACKWGF